MTDHGDERVVIRGIIRGTMEFNQSEQDVFVIGFETHLVIV